MLPRRALLLICLLPFAVGAVPPPPADTTAKVQAMVPEIDKMYAELAAREHLPALVYGIVVDGKLVHSRALGLANVEDRIAATSSTRFRIASMSKSFVAMAVMKLRDEGKLGLDDAVLRYLPEFRHVKLPTTDSPPLTIRMLMTMSTGLPEDNPWGDRQMALDKAALVAFVESGLSFSNTPGEVFEYSNLGYVALGKLVSKVAGVRFQDYVTRELLKPLGMHNTSWEYATVPADKLALGYRWTGSAWEREPMLHDGDAAAMGGLITTADDFARYVALHLCAWPARDGADAGPVKRATLREMHQPRMFVELNVPAVRAAFYGYGLGSTRDGKGVHIVGHSGGLPGFGSQFRFAPEHGVGVFAFSNLRYAPVYAPTATVLGNLISKGGVTARAPAASAILLTRQQQLLRLLQGWDEQLGRDIVADNFFLDRSRSDWIKHAGEQFASIGKVVTVGALKPENRLRGSFPVVGEQGTLTVFFTLTPEAVPRVQEVALKRETAAP